MDTSILEHIYDDVSCLSLPKFPMFAKFIKGREILLVLLHFGAASKCGSKSALASGNLNPAVSGQRDVFQ